MFGIRKKASIRYELSYQLLSSICLQLHLYRYTIFFNAAASTHGQSLVTFYVVFLQAKTGSSTTVVKVPDVRSEATDNTTGKACSELTS